MPLKDVQSVFYLICIGNKYSTANKPFNSCQAWTRADLARISRGFCANFPCPRKFPCVELVRINKPTRGTCQDQLNPLMHTGMDEATPTWRISPQMQQFTHGCCQNNYHDALKLCLLQLYYLTSWKQTKMIYNLQFWTDSWIICPQLKRLNYRE